MNSRYVAGLISAVLLVSPAFAFADFSDTAARAKAQAAALTPAELDNLNTRVVYDAYLTARIVGYDPAEIGQMKADITALKQENARLRAQTPATAASSDLEARVSRLEISFDSLNSTLSLVVKMLTALLAKL